MKFKTLILLALFVIAPIQIFASVSSGTIDPSNKNALVCHDVTCSSPTPGVINFAPTGGTPVTIDDTNGINGVAWGNEIGWITFNPSGAEGLTINPTTGVISGKAWSQGSGWVNFSVTGQSVSINSNGEFTGYAWVGGPFGGWIKFDCSVGGACVKTDWRPLSARPSTGGGTGGAGTGSGGGAGGSTVQNDNPSFGTTTDACPNIIGQQDSVPAGYERDQGGLCLIQVDYCKNISGNQLSVPTNYILNGEGQCVALTDKNKDDLVPTNTNGANPAVDYCPNLFGVQSKVPDGFIKNENLCIPASTDYCPNISGNQYTLPPNMKISDKGECVQMTKQEMSDAAKNTVSGFPDNAPKVSVLATTKAKITLLSLLLLLAIIALLVFFRSRSRL